VGGTVSGGHGLRPSKNGALSILLLVAGLVALVLLLPGLFSTPAPPLQIALGWGAFVVAATLVGGGVGLYLVPKLRESFAPRLHRHIAGQPARLASLKLPVAGWRVVAFGELLLLFLLILTHLATGQSVEVALQGQGGGLVGWAGSALLTGLVGKVLAWAVLLALGALTVWLLCREFLDLHIDLNSERQGKELLVWWSGVFRNIVPGRAANVPAQVQQNRGQDRDSNQVVQSRNARAPSGAADVPPSEKLNNQAKPPKEVASKGRPPRSKVRPDTLPPLNLLRPEQGIPGGAPDVRLRAQTLRQTLAEFGVPVEVVSIKEGPTVTQFGLEPGDVIRELRNGEVQRRRVSVHSIMRLSNDLALALSASSIRIEAPVPGRPYVGVEIPNAAKTLVSLRTVLESNEFARVASPLAAGLGRDVSGDPVVLDLAALPHLLIAGATGSGKSVCINSIVCSLLMSNDPVTVRLVMVDPKMVELPVYNGVPHLLGKVITDPAQVPAALAWLTLQMDERYRIFAASGVRNIAGYNRKAAKSRHIELLPYLVLVVDELPACPVVESHRHTPGAGDTEAQCRRDHGADQGQLPGPNCLCGDDPD
jgi:S-DNA-T family DNA segregation ATPase FtsK/SpoIIIE